MLQGPTTPGDVKTKSGAVGVLESGVLLNASPSPGLSERECPGIKVAPLVLVSLEAFNNSWEIKKKSLLPNNK